MTKSIGMIIAGQIGPGETRLALCGLDAGRPVVVVEEGAHNEDFPTLEAVIQKFLRKYRPPQVRGAAFVVGGPIYDGVSRAPNLAWNVNAHALGTELGLNRVTLLSEAEGIAHALPALARDDIVELSVVGTAEGNQAVLSVGTLPSVAGLYWNGTEHRCVASDGGSADFAPSTEDELRLQLFLSARLGRVPLSHLLSRDGIADIHAYARGAGEGPPPASLRGHAEDQVAQILRLATGEADGACRRTLEIVLGVYGSAAGNLGLALRATGGVYLGGDMVPALRGLLGNGTLVGAFSRKPPLEDVLREIPVLAVVNPKAALLGAATVAARELRAQRGSGWAS